jgi:release factor glutamine methyltransferase
MDKCPAETAAAFQSLVRRRALGEPTQYLTGVQEFYGRDFSVGPGVLIPRPETEHAVERALAVAPADGLIIDLCTGSGAIGITLALELRRRVALTDRSADALRYAAVNARTLGAGCGLMQADLLSAIAPRSAGLIVSNPPYVADGEPLPREVREHEPAIALLAPENGNGFYRRILADAPRVLRPSGWLVMELGWRSAASVAAIAGDAWADVHVGKDLGGRDRVFSARLR